MDSDSNPKAYGSTVGDGPADRQVVGGMFEGQWG